MAAFEGKVALVTGASSGLGAETARRLSVQGATVFGIARDSDRLAEVFSDVASGAYACVDVASAPECRDAVAQRVAELARWWWRWRPPSRLRVIGGMTCQLAPTAMATATAGC